MSTATPVFNYAAYLDTYTVTNTHLLRIPVNCSYVVCFCARAPARVLEYLYSDVRV